MYKRMTARMTVLWNPCWVGRQGRKEHQKQEVDNRGTQKWKNGFGKQRELAISNTEIALRKRESLAS